MIISTAIDLLVQAELKQLSIKDDKNAIRGFINSGILELYKRFNLWEVEAVITMVTGTKLYTLDGNDPNVSIDLSDHDFLMIEEVWLVSLDDDIDDKKLIINDKLDKDGVMTPKYNQVYVTTEIDTRTLEVIYRAAPKFLTNEKADIPLPPQFNEALFNYVGYRGHGSVKGDIKSENNTHYMRFEASCSRIKLEGLYTQDSLSSNKFDTRGFV